MSTKGEVWAVGRIVDGQATRGSTVFGEDNEYHVRVKWEIIVTEDQGVTLQDVSEAKGYNLPIRNVFARIYNHDAAQWIAEELGRRKG